MGLARPIPYTWNVNDVAGAAPLNAQLRDGLTFAQNAPMAVYQQTATQNISSSTATNITWPTPTIDTYGGYASGSPTRYTPTEPGWYQVSATIGYAPNATGGRGVLINKNGTLWAQSTVGSAGSVYGTNPTITTLVYCNGTTDYLEVGAAQNSGSTLGTLTTVTQFCALWAHA